MEYSNISAQIHGVELLCMSFLKKRCSFCLSIALSFKMLILFRMEYVFSMWRDTRHQAGIGLDCIRWFFILHYCYSLIKTVAVATIVLFCFLVGFLFCFVSFLVLPPCSDTANLGRMHSSTRKYNRGSSLIKQ